MEDRKLVPKRLSARDASNLCRTQLKAKKTKQILCDQTGSDEKSGFAAQSRATTARRLFHRILIKLLKDRKPLFVFDNIRLHIFKIFSSTSAREEKEASELKKASAGLSGAEKVQRRATGVV